MKTWAAAIRYARKIMTTSLRKLRPVERSVAMNRAFTQSHRRVCAARARIDAMYPMLPPSGPHA
jgi:hypothetical protein